MYTTLLVFDDCLLVERIPTSENPFWRHMEAAMAYLGEPGFLGSSLVPPGNEIPSHEHLVQVLKEA
jgi:hypothetical protein